MTTATVTTKGRVTIPKSVRNLLGIKSGDQVDFVITGRGDVVLRDVGGDIRELRGMLKRDRQRSVTVREMNAAVLRHHARNR